jgi:hypothetical protein
MNQNDPDGPDLTHEMYSSISRFDLNADAAVTC